jgi:hypothetical protein
MNNEYKSQAEFQTAMDAAFQKVMIPGQHWKDRICKMVEAQPSEVDQIVKAIEFFTGTKATVERLDVCIYRIRAAGYWAGPCA